MSTVLFFVGLVIWAFHFVVILLFPVLGALLKKRTDGEEVIPVQFINSATFAFLGSAVVVELIALVAKHFGF